MAARPTGESLSPYIVCGRVPSITAYAACLYSAPSCSIARCSPAERSDGSAPPVWIALSISGGNTPGKLVWIPSSSGGAGSGDAGASRPGHVLVDERAVVAACRHEPLVAEAL